MQVLCFECGVVRVHTCALLQQSHPCSSPQIERGLVVSFSGDPLLCLLHARFQRLPCLPRSGRIAGDTWTCKLSIKSRRGWSLNLATIKHYKSLEFRHASLLGIWRSSVPIHWEGNLLWKESLVKMLSRCVLLVNLPDVPSLKQVFNLIYLSFPVGRITLWNITDRNQAWICTYSLFKSRFSC